METMPSPKMLPHMKFTKGMTKHMSPRDVALHGTEAGRSKSSFGIGSYKPKLVNFNVRGIAFNKDRETSFIETEANYRKAFPGVGQYITGLEKDWTQ
jgi:hypothetical protein